MDTSPPLPPPPRRAGDPSRDSLGRDSLGGDPLGRDPLGDPAGEPTAASAGPTPPTPPSRRLYRAPAGERVIGGVAAGLADHTGVPPGIIRLLFIVTTFTGGVGILAYIVGLIAMPERPAHIPATTQEPGLRLDSAGAIAGVVLIVFAVSILFADIGWWSGSVVWALLLIGAGVLLYRRADAAPDGAQRPAAPTAPTGSIRDVGPGANPRYAQPAAIAPAGPGYRGPGGLGGAAPLRSEPPVPVRPRPRPRSPLGRMTVAAALVVTGAALWLQQVDVAVMTGVQIGALVLAVLGAGLLVGTFWGRARWLVVPAVVLAIPLLVASTFNVPFTLNAGERRVAPVGASAVAPAYSLGAGELVVDLSGVDLSGQTLAVEASVGVGELVVTVPDGAAVEVSSTVGVGEYDLLGRGGSGSSLEHTVVRAGNEGRGTLQLKVGVVLGTITVRGSDDPPVNSGDNFRGTWHNPRSALEDL